MVIHQKVLRNQCSFRCQLVLGSEQCAPAFLIKNQRTYNTHLAASSHSIFENKYSKLTSDFALMCFQIKILYIQVSRYVFSHLKILPMHKMFDT